MKRGFNKYALCIYGIIGIYGTNLMPLVPQMQLVQSAKHEC
ncbi:MAG: hypothetical protein ACYCZ2_14865 [Lutibacter sp.]